MFLKGPCIKSLAHNVALLASVNFKRVGGGWGWGGGVVWGLEWLPHWTFPRSYRALLKVEGKLPSFPHFLLLAGCIVTDPQTTASYNL